MFTMAIMTIAFGFLTTQIRFWVIIGMTVVLTLLSVFFIYKNEKTAFIIAGVFLGGISGMLCYTCFGLYNFEPSGSNIFLWLCIVAGAGIAAAVCYFYDQ